MSQMIPQYNTMLFCELYDDADDFLAAWKDSAFYQLTVETGATPPYTVPLIADKYIKLTYSLLLARYGSNPVANMSTDLFYLKVNEIIFQYAPTWTKRWEVQKAVRALTPEEVEQGAKVIHNHAFNPSTQPGTSTLNELEFINEQTTQNYKKSKLEAYNTLNELLITDVTEQYVEHFKKLFKQCVMPEKPLLYATQVEEGEEE